MSSTNSRHTSIMDSEAELNQLKAERNLIRAELNQLKAELCKKEESLEVAKHQIDEQSKTISFLEGQIRAFEFCIVEKGSRRNGY